MPHKTYRGTTYRSRTYKNNGRPKAAVANKRRGPKKDYIDPSRFVKIAKVVETTAYVAKHAFEDFEIDTLIKNNLRAKGFVAPSAIQDQAIPYALQGRDVIGVADTGTGKTVAFALPVLQAAIARGSRSLIVAPTRELAQQINAELRSLSKGSNVRTAVLIGGTGMGLQLRDLQGQPAIVIGTPGRIKDHLERGSLRLDGFTAVVLDEVDRMLDMGFVNDMRTILSRLNPTHQSLFFSATLDNRVETLINSFATDPLTVSVKTGDTGENIHQNIIRLRADDDKLEKLHDLLIGGDIHKAIIFDDTQRSVQRLSTELIARGFKADAIHGGKTQGQRQRSLAKFKHSEITILVATDVAARGIDVTDVTHVINYSTPNSYADYVHRIGRAGRAGKVGYALTFIGQ